MKKIALLTVALLLTFTAASCGGEKTPVSSSESTAVPPLTTVDKSKEKEERITLLADPHFLKGMYYTGIKNSLINGRFDYSLSVPQWLYTQEGCKHNLGREGIYSSPSEGVHVYEDESKLLYLDTNTGLFKLGINGSRDYTAPKISAGALVTPTFTGKLYVNEMDHLYVTLDFTLDEVTNRMDPSEFNTDIHTIQFNFYMFFQDSKSTQWFYLGLPLYDIRGTGQTTYIGGDAGTGGTMVYIPSRKSAYGRSDPAIVGERFTQTVDILRFAETAFKTGIAKGYLSGCRLEDFYISGCNLGWEVSGSMDGMATVYEFNVAYVPKQ